MPTCRPNDTANLHASQGISLVAGRQLISHLLAASGYGPLARAAELIAAGKVAVNGRVLTDLRSRADPQTDRLAVEGRVAAWGAPCRYIMLHKPYGVVCAFTDAEGRPTLADYVPVPEVYAAGRLDYDSEGLLLLTSDGWLNHRITHPQYEHPKTYLVQVERVPDEDALQTLREGVVIQGERTRPAEVTLLHGANEPDVAERSVPIRYRLNVPTAWLKVVLREGRKRQLRHMTAAVGFPTLRLIRVAVGPLELGALPVGTWRELSAREIELLAELLRAPRAISDASANDRNSSSRSDRSPRR